MSVPSLNHLPVDQKVFFNSIDVVVVLCPVLPYFQLLLPCIALSGVESHAHALKNGCLEQDENRGL